MATKRGCDRMEHSNISLNVRRFTSIYNQFQYLPEKKRLIGDVDRYFASLMLEGAAQEGAAV